MAEATVRGIATMHTYLMSKATEQGTYAKVCDITAFPDMIGVPERIDITTLSDVMRLYIKGVQDADNMQFDANYTPANFQAVKTLEGHQYWYAVYFGSNETSGQPDGHDGKFEWTGDVSVGLRGGGVNEAVGMSITCFPSSEITSSFDAG